MTPPLSDLAGLWRRSSIEWPDGRCDTATDVRWLQGARLFADLRQPPPTPRARGADGALDECLRLAEQHGFAGHLTFDGRHFEWHRLIDFQPPSGEADAGSLEWQDDVLIERGRDRPYLERWHRARAERLDAIGGASLRDAERGTRAMLLRAGENFAYVRDRAGPLPRGATLAECVVGAASLGAARALIDCEISLGRVSGGGWRIERSSLQGRVGDTLILNWEDRRLGIAEHGANGRKTTKTWEILEFEASPEVFRR